MNMPLIVRYIAAFIVFMHGLVHLLYFVSYWPLAEIEDIPYKTTLFFDRWDVGSAGIRLFAFLNLVVTVGFVIAAIAFAVDTDWWRPLMAITAVVSLVLNILDFKMAYGGPIVNIIILVLIWFAPRLGW
jgi:hypothetical protein